MVNYDSEIKRILIKFLRPFEIEKWFDKPAYAFGGKTPRYMLENGRGEEVFNIVNDLYKVEEKALLRTKVGSNTEP